MNEWFVLLLCCCLIVSSACGGSPVPLARQPFSDAGHFITRDFSGVHGLKFPESSRPLYEAALLDLLNSRVGVYEGDVSGIRCEEWEGARTLVLRIDNNADVEIAKTMDDGRSCPLPDAEEGMLSDTAIFLGPRENGLLFLYGAFGDSINALFCPNGIQIPIRFRRVGELPKATRLPGSKMGKVTDGSCMSDARIEKLPSGTYEAMAPSALEHGFEKQYLVCTKGTAYTVFFKGSNYWYDVNFERTDMRRLVGPFGRYSFNGMRLKFHKVPVGLDEVGMLALAVRKASGERGSGIAELEAKLLRTNQARREAGDLYALDNRNPQTMTFIRRDRLPMTLGNTRICTCDCDITTSEKVLYYLELLNGR